MIKFIANTYLLITESIVLILTILWYCENYEKEPLIGIIVSFTALISGIIYKIKEWKTFSTKIEQIERNKNLKNLFKRELYKPFNPNEPLIGPNRFNCSTIIIHHIKYNSSDKNTPDKHGWYKYFGGEPYHINDDGIDLIIGLEKGYIDEKKEFILNNKSTKYYKHGILPYSNILNYDLNNDEYRPYMYCKYKGKLGPFSKVYYRKVN